MILLLGLNFVVRYFVDELVSAGRQLLWVDRVGTCRGTF